MCIIEPTEVDNGSQVLVTCAMNISGKRMHHLYNYTHKTEKGIAIYLSSFKMVKTVLFYTFWQLYFLDVFSFSPIFTEALLYDV